jgi:hypothetical protein
MRTAHDILSSRYSCTCDVAYKSRDKADPSCVLCYEGKEIEGLMDEWAKETSVEFAEWKDFNYISYQMREGLYYHKRDLLKHISEATVFTTAELFDLYQQEKSSFCATLALK